VKLLALKAKVTREQTSNNSDSQDGSDEDINDDEEAEAFNLMARNFLKGNHLDAEIDLAMELINLVKTVVKALGTKENEELLKFNKDLLKLLKEKRSLENENSKLSSKINDLEIEVKKLANDKEVSLKCDLLPDDWIVDNGCTKHMTGNRRLFTLYKAYDGRHVIFWSNLNDKVIGGGNITHDSITITNVEHVSSLSFVGTYKSKGQSSATKKSKYC
ncbi:hypothetical protein Tco_1381816, partial [Tanacetum coccineum]